MVPAFTAADKTLGTLTECTSETQNLDCKCKERVLHFLFVFTYPFKKKKKKNHDTREIKVRRSVGFFDVFRGRL